MYSFVIYISHGGMAMAFKGDLDALILGILKDRKAHGYEIAKRISKETEALVKVGEGQLYPALHRLEDSGSIEAEWIQQEGKPARKVYAITEKGVKELAMKRDAWQKLATGINSILGSVKKAGVHHA
jgi:DNA-binding PadR family transcriptional regulator